MRAHPPRSVTMGMTSLRSNPMGESGAVTGFRDSLGMMPRITYRLASGRAVVKPFRAAHATLDTAC